MRSVLAVILIIYLIGAGIALSPTIRSTPASALSASIGREMPYARARGQRCSFETPQLGAILPSPALDLPRVKTVRPRGERRAASDVILRLARASSER